MQKYGTQKTEIDGMKFDSKHEANRWTELKYMERAGLITDLQRQVTFVLIPVQRDYKGKVIERSVKYIADFVYCANDGNGWEQVVEDAKSPVTRTNAVYKIKKKLMLSRFGIQIKEV